MSKKKWLLVILIVFIFLFIVIGSMGASTSNENGGVLETGDLKLNMSGYDYNLVANSSTNVSSTNSYSEMYEVTGEDSFSLTIMVMDDTYGAGSLGESNTQMDGGINAVAENKYINGKYYWIQLSGANDEHNNKEYLDSLIISD